MRCLGAFNLAKQLAPFSTAVVHKSLYVLSQGLNSIRHICVKGLGAHEALDKIVKSLKNFSISRENSSALPGIRVVFGLLGFHALVLEELAIKASEVTKEDLLLMIGLEESVLVGAVLFEFRSKQMGFVICNGLFIKNKHRGYIVSTNLCHESQPLNKIVCSR